MMHESASRLELWGGLECTVNRVGDRFFDQFQRSGHAHRQDDLDRIAALGIRTLRYPALWEWSAPDNPGVHDWTWPDERLCHLRRLGVRPIVGLVHHGGGPRYTNLLDPDFASGLAAYAGHLAQRFAWVEDYTPVNEPLTTARFAGLYGVWHPHGADGRSFVRCLLNQCRAVVLAMRAIRAVRSDARLVQTEDLGQTHATSMLRYQADFENERRWLTFDLLCGRVDRAHPMAHYFRFVGVEEAEWLWFADNPCPPDVIGINHYLTSERFLDHRLERYPPSTHGGNGRRRYADVEAVRVCAELTGPAGLLEAAWKRYGRTLAVTEAHLGCTREEQLRWLAEVWRAAEQVRAGGADIRAVTIWSLQGAYDWDSLVTQSRGHYEPGAFDLRGPTPRPTALAALARNLATGGTPDHPVLSVPGWWRRPERLSYPLEGVAANAAAALDETERARPLLLTGAGPLVDAFVAACRARGLSYRLLSHRALDVGNRAAVEAALLEFDPWAVVCVADVNREDPSTHEMPVGPRADLLGPLALARACANQGVSLLTFSTDLVFDGRQRTPQVESDPVHPRGVVGKMLANAERRVARCHPAALIVRTGPIFGTENAECFLLRALRRLAQGECVAANDHETVSPTYAVDLVQACLDLLVDGASGVWHLANPGAKTWAEVVRAAATRVGLDATRVTDRSPRRLLHSVLASERGVLLPPLESALDRWLAGRPPFAPEACAGRGGCATPVVTMNSIESSTP